MKYLPTLSSPCFIQVFRTSISTSRAVSPAPVSLAASQTGTGVLRQAEPGRQAAGQADRQAGTKMSLIIRRRRGSSSASKSSIRRFVITEKAPTRAFSWLKATTTAFTFKIRHY